MKRNIDLTENRDFQDKLFQTRRSFSPMVGATEYYAEARKRFKSDEYLHDKGLIFQGNSHEREIKKLTTSFNDGIYCDRCGSSIIPYDNDTLCRVCRKKLRYSAIMDNIFWLQRKER